MDKDDVLNEWTEEENKVDKKSAKKLVWRTRISITFTVIRTLLAILLLYIVYMIPTSIYYDTSGKADEFNRVVTTMVELRYPGIAVDLHETWHAAEITPFLTQKTTLPIYRQVGEWKVAVGEVTASKSILFGKINYSVDLDNKYIDEGEMGFALSSYALHDKPATPPSNPNPSPLFDQLEKIDDGHVAQVSFSTRERMEPEQLRKIISKYDVEIHQMPIYAGELKAFNVGMSSSGSLTWVDGLLLRPFIEYDDKNRWSSKNHALTRQEDLAHAVDQFYQDLEWLIEHGDYYDKETDEKRLSYLKENELAVYGATVTGPIREIERLKEEEMFYEFNLGGIEVWNWE
ncbi:anti-sigma factor [Aquibacillus koreensis]|uniref:Anti-sigma factor n=1 Tax=Aquibacillus koreensis TaxID=279446 RepID=A0A9X3WJ70_9BACI|nr:anti-sigma factor [Aquibacillus koreensis]MCT2534806.1 anti-sigma factor [Aquibacillus koreensis]MDC3419583.1 anti-sigma factor [Aquibacillus koreensis]